MTGEEEPAGFLARWSRRKRAAEAEAPPDPAPDSLSGPAAERDPTEPPQAACPIPTLPEIDLASLPPIEALTAESDFAAFLRPGVPPLLRQAALRRMWSLDIGIRDYIGPVEYQWDFNTPGGLPHGFASELVGDLRQLLAQAIGQRDEAEAKPPATAEEAPSAEPEPEAPEAELLAESPALEPMPALAPEPPGTPRRRHGSALPV